MSLLSLSFGSPWLLVCLLAPALALAAYLWFERRPPSRAVPYPNLAVLATVATRPSRLRHAVAALLLAALTLLCVGVARPRLPVKIVSDRATVVLVVDVSISMNATDVAPTRLEAARAAISAFVARVPKRVRIGLIAFADDPVVVTPPTTDRNLLRQGIASLTPGYGTAIGDAVARAVELVRAATGERAAGARSAAKPDGAVVLLSDGSQTRGILAPADGARLARQAGIPVYTIALGTLSGMVTISRGGVLVTVPVPPDRETLAQIAEATGGSTFEATDAIGLGSVYRRLGSVVATTSRPKEVTASFVAAAAALLACAIAVASLTAPRLP